MKLKLILNAKVPILKFITTAAYGCVYLISAVLQYLTKDLGTLACDFSINQPDGPKVANMFLRAMTILPVNALVLMNKPLLSKKMLKDVNSGGVGSYVLSIMVVCFLKVCFIQSERTLS